MKLTTPHSFQTPSHQISESLTYYLTAHVLNLNLDLYMPSLDDASTGLSSCIDGVTSLIKLHDRAVYTHLTSLKCEGTYWLMRWITTIFSREFDMPEVVRIWDVFLTNERITPYICCAMVCLVRNTILQEDFAGCLELLQNYPQEVDVEDVLNGAKG